MMRWFKKDNKTPGWMVIGITDNRLSFVHGSYQGSGKGEIFGITEHEATDINQTLARGAKELHLGRHHCATMLAPGQYQVLLVEAPNVPQQELKNAIRWRVKDLLDYHVDDATIDVLDIPVEKGAVGRGHSMYAVAARNDLIQSCISRFEECGIALSVIDIPETAQRNIASLYEEQGRAVAALCFDDSSGLLTINYGGELYLVRRFELALGQVSARGESARDDAYDRIVLELQRSFDHFDRQFQAIPIAKLVLAPDPRDSGLADHLRSSLGMPVAAIHLPDVLDFASDIEVTPELQWRLFHLIGSTLRHEVTVL